MSLESDLKREREAHKRAMGEDTSEQPRPNGGDPTNEDAGTPRLGEVADRLSYPLEMLGPLLGGAAEAIAHAVQVAPEVAAQSVLAVAAFAAQDKANIAMDGRVHPLSLFLLSVALSGERKTSADRVAAKPLHDWQHRLAGEHRKALEQYRNDADLHDACRRDILADRKRKQEDRAAALGDLRMPTQPPEPLVICQEPSLEGLQRSFRLGRPSQALFNDEGGQFFGGYAMDPKNALKTVSGLSRYWDGSPIVRTRSAAGESAVMYHRRLSVHLLAQPKVAAEVLANKLLQEQGILARFLITDAVPLAGTRLYRPVNPFDARPVKEFHARIEELLEFVPETDDCGGLVLQSRPIAAAAKALWIETYNGVELHQAPGSLLELVRATASKAGEQALRLAGVFSVIEGTAEVTEDQMRRACSLAMYYLNSSLRAAQLAEHDSTSRAAHDVLDWLKSRKVERVTIDALSKQLPRPHRRSVAHIRRLLALLVEADRARVTAVNSNGAPAEWEIR